MTNLSPAAQAVLDAFTEDSSLHDWKHNHWNTEALAAALRAAANIGDSYNCSSAEALDLIIAIAAELKAK